MPQHQPVSEGHGPHEVNATPSPRTTEGRIDWGNVPAWLAALLTGASVAALVRGRLRDRSEAKEHQARLVRMLVARDPERADAAVGYPLAYNNYSDEPIIDLVFTTKWGAADEDEMHTVVSALGPKEHGIGSFVSLDPLSKERPRCWMRFTDSGGNYWHLEGAAKARMLTKKEVLHYERRISLAFDPDGPTWYSQPYHHRHQAETLFGQTDGRADSDPEGQQQP